MSRWKQRTRFQYNRATGAPLWQARFYDHVLRCDEDQITTTRYIVENPVRAGLIGRPGEYPRGFVLNGPARNTS
jgi:putative transposase